MFDLHVHDMVLEVTYATPTIQFEKHPASMEGVHVDTSCMLYVAQGNSTNAIRCESRRTQPCFLFASPY